MSADHAFRPQLESLEDRCQPSNLAPVHGSALPHRNPGTPYIFSPFQNSLRGISFTGTQQPAQSHQVRPVRPGVIVNPFTTQGGISIQVPAWQTAAQGRGVVFNPFQ